MTFLENDIFRWHVDPSKRFNEYATPNSSSHKGKIQIRSDKSDDYSKPAPTVAEENGNIKISVNDTVVKIDKATTLMSVESKGKKVIEEIAPLSLKTNATVQKLSQDENEYFFGGGTQNGRFTHKGEKINIVNESNWIDGGVASPNPFYWSTKGYGVLRNTFIRGQYDFGKEEANSVTTQHNENQFDAYYFLGDTPTDVLQGYYKVTGNPVLLPEYAYYLGHLNAYNRDGWTKDNLGSAKGWKLEDGEVYYEHGRKDSYKLPVESNGKIPTDSNIIPETLNAESPLSDLTYEQLYKFSARAVIDGHNKFDMPLGYFLPNDGYGAGYGQNGYYDNYPLGSNSDLAAREKAINGNIENLRKFTEYANERGVQTGLWTQSALTPDTSQKSRGYYGFQTLRDFNKEVNQAGVRTLKTDVAWVGPGYSMALDATKTGFEGIAATKTRPNIITLDGWAGTQRHGAIWTGDQDGGNWEYIRFHIPTYIGQSLSGNPNIGSDIDGIFRGSSLITTRDFQWKTFTPLMLDMDGWGEIPKKPYGHSDDNDNINRMYLKLKAELMPYLYTTAHEAIDGKPMIRAMFLEYPNEAIGYTNDVKYQYLYGSQFLVAPVYKNTNADKNGNDIRNGIYLPDSNEIWLDYFSGKAYAGGQSLNDFDAPLWKLPLFVKSGSIVPMYEENNNPAKVSETNEKGLDKTKRVVEFFASEDKTNTYTSIEDDGMYMDALDEQGNEKANVSYGGNVKTKFTSTYDGENAKFVVEPSTGSYNGYDSNRSTTLIINATEKPKTLNVTVGGEKLALTEATTKAQFEALKLGNEAVSFYDVKPNLNKYSQGTTGFAAQEINTNPKLYVYVPNTNVKANSITVDVTGFAYDFNLDKEEINTSLETPKFGKIDTTPTTITLNWNKVQNATSYDIKVNGITQIGIKADTQSITYDELTYNSTHTYQIRSRNAKGYSEWSEEIEVTTDLDPWRNVPIGKVTSKIKTFSNGHSAYAMKNAFDQKFNDNLFFTEQSGNSQFLDEDIIIEYDKVYTFDHFTYHHNKYTSIKELDIYASLDGVHYEMAFKGSTQPFEKSAFKTVIEGHPQVDVKLDNIKAKFIKIVPRSVNSTGSSSGFGASEFILYKADGSKGYPLGDITLDGLIDDGDLTQIGNYQGSVAGDDVFDTQVKGNNADINNNGVFDVYDYSFVLTQVDGGTTKTGKPVGSITVDHGTQKNLKANETITLKFAGEGLKYINSVGAIFEYDSNKYEIVSINGSSSLKDMENLSNKSSGTGTTKTATIAFNNKGNRNLVSGSSVDLLTLELKAKVDAPVIYPEEFILIGPKNDFITVNVNNLGISANKDELNKAVAEIDKFLSENVRRGYSNESWDKLLEEFESSKLVLKSEDSKQALVDESIEKLKSAYNGLENNVLKPNEGIKNITFTNDAITEDDGSKLWQQSNWKQLLFDGNKTSNLAEFKYRDFGAEVSLPMDFNIDFENPIELVNAKVYNRTGYANGIIKSIHAVGITEDDQKIDLGSFDKQADIFEFSAKNLDDSYTKATKFKRIIITPTTSIGKATVTEGSEFNRMLSIYEIEIHALRNLDFKAYNEVVDRIEAINPNEYTEESIAILNKIKEQVNSIIKEIDDQTTLDQLVKELGDLIDNLEQIKGANKAALESLLHEINDFMETANPEHYEPSVVEALVVEFEKALAIMENEEATQAQVDEVVASLDKAFKALERIVYTPEKGIKSIIFSNDKLGEDDGSGLWQQANWKELMFDGNKKS